MNANTSRCDVCERQEPRTTAGTATDADGDLYLPHGGNALAASRTVHDK